MSHDSIQLLIDGRYPDPDGAGYLGVPIRSIVIDDSLAGHEADLVRGAGLSGRVAVVADPDTRDALGARVLDALSNAGDVEPVILDRHPHADDATAEWLEARTGNCDALVAVGSGTINDLCKYAAARLDKPYGVFATAPSMNGYTSANAAVTVDGHKKSLPASVPAGVFVDLAVFAAAPARMIRAGLGDSACRSTAQVDWLLSHHLHDTPYLRAPFALLADDEPALLSESDALLHGDLAAMRRLARTLILSGIGMTLCGGSQPASQGEHLISHYMDMMSPPDRPAVLHGEQVAVTTLTMARLQQDLLESTTPPRVAPTPVSRADLVAHFGSALGESCWRELEPKLVTADSAEQVNARLAERWDRIVSDCRAASIGPERLQDVLTAAGAPTRPADIAVDDAFYGTAVLHARELRNRYTFLDLAGDAGRIESPQPRARQ